MDDKNIPPDRKPCSWKYSFTTKRVFCHSEATICVTWKVANLDVQIWVFFLGNCVFATVKRDFLGYFHRTNSGIFFTRSFATSLQSSQAASCTCWWISIATFWHITWHLCAWHPKSWGWIVCSWSTQHQSCLYGIWWWSGRAGHPSQIRSVATCNVARIPEISAA